MTTINSHYDDAPYDDDALINDFVNAEDYDNFGPPANGGDDNDGDGYYDDDFIAMIEEEQNQKQNQSTAPLPQSQPPSPPPSSALNPSAAPAPAPALVGTFNTNDEIGEKARTEGLGNESSIRNNTVPIEVTIGESFHQQGKDTLRKNKKEDQLYSFQR